jgi:mannose-6-phosphate isomerase-like protein (cupin superfamily)
MPQIARRILSLLSASMFAGLLPAMVFAQDKSALRPVRVVMASNKLQVAGDNPLHYRLLSVAIPAGKSATFAGSNGFLFVTGGIVDLASGSENLSLAEGEAKFLAADAQATLRASGPKPATVLHYLLAPAAAINEKPYAGAATVTELYRGKDAAPLSAGPHEFSLTRVSVPSNAPTPPMHHRSGAALYRVLSGTATIHMQGRDEPRSTGAVQYEPHGFIHTWENTGKIPLVLLQSNISAEGAPEIIWLK